jgi:nitroreductase
MPDIAPLRRRPEVLDFLLSRRSRPAKTLVAPGPSRAEIGTILTAAARSPDHGKLEPWRFIVIEGAAMTRLRALAARRAAEEGMDEEGQAKASRAFGEGASIIAVVASPKQSAKIPAHEQILSAGAVCLAAVNAALAMGWGANWLSGWLATDPAFLAEGLGIGAPETVAGFIHLGTETMTPPERPRPDIAALTRWVDS